MLRLRRNILCGRGSRCRDVQTRRPVYQADAAHDINIQRQGLREGARDLTLCPRILLGKRSAVKSRGGDFWSFPERARREFRLPNDFNSLSNEAMVESGSEKALELRVRGACTVSL